MTTLTPPASHRNLVAWFVTDPEPAGAPEYMVLEEAMEKHPRLLHETGNVNELLIENPGDMDMFIQAGDIVKGGRQDRTLGTDFIVPARSGQIPVPVFCVEASRWHKRRNESAAHFSTSTDIVASKKLHAALRSRKAQHEVWESVAEEQMKLTKASGVSAHSQESPSSLQLSYELGDIQKRRREYCEALENRKPAESRGVIWAINGRLSHADIFASPSHFTKVWRKLLNAAALEALGESIAPVAESSELPDADQIQSWLNHNAPTEEENLPPRTRVQTQKSPTHLRFNTFDTQCQAPIHVTILAQG